MTENDYRKSLGRDSLLERGKRAVFWTCFPRHLFFSGSDIRDLIWIAAYMLILGIGNLFLLIEYLS
jgi:hypothetical protein